jgi:16S rRNA U1498 N3-methylase RsmE
MITLLVEAGVLAPERQIQLAEAERHHLKVRRARDGEQLRLLDGRGGAGQAMLVGNPSEGLVQISIVDSVPAPVTRGLASRRAIVTVLSGWSRKRPSLASRT